jgi:hypothetical protein
MIKASLLTRGRQEEDGAQGTVTASFVWATMEAYTERKEHKKRGSHQIIPQSLSGHLRGEERGH